MSRRLIVRAEAEFDITEAAVWYEGREPGLGLQLTAEIRAAFSAHFKIRLHFCVFANTRTVRRVLVGGFPYRVFTS